MRDPAPRQGSRPLAETRVVEFAGLGPTPFAGMLLADLGAEVVRIERAGSPAASPGDPAFDTLRRGRPGIVLDLKTAAGRDAARELAAHADVLLEGFRPGVMERLELGPAELLAADPRLIYARMTGWGQTGPLATKAGHDINYLALTGGLHMMGPPDRPPFPPINFVGDYGGGGMVVVCGILAALLARAQTGRGQVIDAAMVDGSSLLMTQMFAWTAMGAWRPVRGANLLDGGAYFYRCYEAADGGYLAVGALEPQFHDALLRGLGLDPADFPDQLDPAHWPERADALAAIFRTAPRDDWVACFAPYDACVTPVLTLAEAVTHPANVARGVHLPAPGGVQPAFAPRLSDTPAHVGTVPDASPDAAADRLVAWGVDPARARALAVAR
jgi:alpha-methylacyl-CoA racemase